MSGKRLVFGESPAASRVRLDEHLLGTSVAAEGIRKRAAQEAVDLAFERMAAAGRPVVPGVAVTRRKHVKWARDNTIAPCVTGGVFRSVYRGIDTYVANTVGGEVREDFMLLLEVAQMDAKEIAGDVLGPFPPFLGCDLAIRGYGGGTFSYFLSNADVTVKVRRADHAPMLAAAQVQLSAACLHRLGFRAALVALEAWVGVWCPGARLQPSRVDLCADTQGWRPTFADFAARAFVSPCSRPYLQLDGADINYARFGTGGREGSRSGAAPIQFVMYDKSEEIRTHDKGWFVPLWAAAGPVDAMAVVPSLGAMNLYDGEEGVFRLEARFTREYLHDRMIETQGQLLASLGALWLEALDWCRYVVPREGVDDNHRSVLEVRPEWQVLAAVSWGDEDGRELARIDQARPRLERTLAAIGGHMVTLQALLVNVMDADLRGLAEMAVPALLKRWEARGEDFAGKVEARALRLGGLALA